MKRLISLILTICVMTTFCVVIPAQQASAAITSGIFAGEVGSWRFDDVKGVLTISGKQIPNYENVDSVPWKSFRDKIKKVVIKEGITIIGSNAFNQCSNLAEVVIPKSVWQIQEWAFAYCHNLKKIDLPRVMTLIRYSFFNCYCLEEVKLSDKYCQLNASFVFKDCYNLKKIDLGALDYWIPSESFTECDVEEIEIPGTVERIYTEAFKNCEKLKKVILSPGVKTIYRDAFHISPIEDVYFKGTKEQWDEIEIYDEKILNAKLHFVNIYGQETTNGANDFDGYEDFLTVAKKKHIIPGLGDGMVPQGIAYRAENNHTYMTAYDASGKRQSVIMELDSDTGEYLGEYYLKSASGEDFFGHVGGIAVSDKNIYIANGKKLSRISLDKLDSAENKTDIAFDEDIRLALGSGDDYAGISFCDVSDGMLWLGNFYYSGNADYRKKAYDGYKTLIYGYELDSGSADGFKEESKTKNTTDYKYVPDVVLDVDYSKMQGVTVIEDKLLISRSYGRGNDSELVIMNLPDISESKEYMILDKNEKIVPILVPEEIERLECIPMMEDLTSNSGSVYAMFESGAEKYASGDNKTDSYWEIGIRPIVGDGLPVIVLPGIMGSTMKNTGGLGIPVLTDKYDFIPQEELEIADSLAVSSSANKLIKKLKKNGIHKVYPCPYDWRLPVDEIAEKYLKPTIEKAKKYTGKDKVILVAHSMGGLVSRSYIQSAGYDFDVDSLYMLGTPNEGATTILPLVDYGVPYNAAHAVVLSENYPIFTGEEYNILAKDEVRSFVNNQIKSTAHLLPAYGAYYYDTESGKYLTGTTNEFLAELNRDAVTCGRYQKIDGVARNKVKTIIIAAEDVDTAQAIKIKGDIQNGAPVYTDDFVGYDGSESGFVWDALVKKTFFESVKLIGDGTVPTHSAIASMEGLNKIWTVDRGSYGEHVKLFGGLRDKVAGYMDSEIILMSIDEAQEEAGEEDKPYVRINLSGVAAASLSDGYDEIDIYEGYSAESFDDGKYTIGLEKEPGNGKMTAQISYFDGEEYTNKVFSFLNDKNKIEFTVEDGVLLFNEIEMRDMMSFEQDGKALLLFWDDTEGKHNIYKKKMSDEGFEFVAQTPAGVYEYLTDDDWVDGYSEDAIFYYIIPVTETQDPENEAAIIETEGYFNTSLRNYNNTDVTFKYEYVTDTGEPTVYFENTSFAKIETVEWDFDGDSVIDSTEWGCEHTYKEDGIYDVTLRITGPFGASEITYPKLIKIGVNVERLEITSENAGYAVGDKGSFSALKVWNDADATKEPAENVVFQSSNPDIILVNEDGSYEVMGYGVATVTAASPEAVGVLEVQTSSERVEINTVVSGNGKVGGGGKLAIGEIANLGAFPCEKEEFLGWYVGDECVCTDKEYTFEVTEKLDITARFTENTYVLQVLDGEEPVYEARILKNGEIILPDALEKEEAVFIGYYTDKDLTIPFTDDMVFDKDTQIYAKFESTTCIISVMDGEKVVSENKIFKNTGVELPAEIEKDGYVFDGYFLDAEFTAPLTKETVFADDSCVYIKYLEIKEYKGYLYITKEDFVKLVGYSGNGDEMIVPSSIEGVKVKEIADRAFAGTDANYVYIPMGIEVIGEEVFDGAYNLWALYYPGYEEDWNNIQIAENNEVLNKISHSYQTMYGGLVDCYAYSSYDDGILSVEVNIDRADTDFEVEVLISNGDDYTLADSRAVMQDYTGTLEFEIPFKGDDNGHYVSVEFVAGTAARSCCYNEYFYAERNFEGAEYDGIYYLENEDGTLAVEGSKNTYITVRPYVDGKKVTTIIENAFYNTDLHNIVLPYTLESIGENAFYGCDNLEEVNYVGSLEKWGEVVVGSGNDALTNKLKPDYSDVVQIWHDGYYDNGHFVMNLDIQMLLAEAEAYVEVYEIDNMTGVLGECIHSGYYEIPMGVKSYTFNICPFEADNKQYTIKGNFVDKNDRSKVLKEIWTNGFFTAERERCAEGDWEYYCYDGISEIAGYMGEGEEKLVIPDTLGGCPVTKIGDWSLCIWIQNPVKEIVIPESVTYIGDGALTIPTLEKVYIPSKVEMIGDFVFDGCRELKEINIASDNKNYASINGDMYTKDSKTLLLYAPGKSNTTYQIHEGTEKIGMGAFAGNAALEEIILPKSLKEIDEYAFTGCQSLKTVTFAPEDCIVRIIGNNAFNHTGIEEINIPESVEIIGDEAFMGCMNLHKVNVSENVEIIGKGAFASCENLYAINVSENNKNYSSVNGSLCSKDKKELFIWVGERSGHIEIPGHIESIAEGALSNLEIKTLYIPKSVKAMSIDGYTLNNVGSILYAGSEEEWQKLFAEYANYSYKVICDSPKRNYASVQNYNSYYENGKVTMHMRWVQAMEDAMVVMAVYDKEGRLVSVARENVTDSLYDLKMSCPADEACLGGTVKLFFRKCDDYLESYGKVIVSEITEPVFESVHYVKDAHDIDIYEYDGECESISLTFSGDTHMKEYYYISISPTTEDGGSFTNDELSGATVTVPGNRVEISMMGDPDGECYGYKVDKIVINK